MWNVSIPSPLDFNDEISVLEKSINVGETIEDLIQLSVFSPKRIGWNYPIDYIQTLIYFDKFYSPGIKVFDIGCGPSPLHKLLEHLYGIDIVGIDTRRWEKGDVVDYQGSMFLNESFTRSVYAREGRPDLIISCSAFEHLPLNQHSKCVQEMNHLNCKVISTTCIGSTGLRQVSSNQISLSYRDIMSIYGINAEQGQNLLNSAAIAYEKYKVCELIMNGYYKRFPQSSSKRYLFKDFLKGIRSYKILSSFSINSPQYLTALCLKE
jgi:hypothetical protein